MEAAQFQPGRLIRMTLERGQIINDLAVILSNIPVKYQSSRPELSTEIWYKVLASSDKQYENQDYVLSLHAGWNIEDVGEISMLEKIIYGIA
jgi:hypothetical protein